jgi:hypothetical protein
MDKIKALKELLTAAESDAEKFYNKGNSAAGTRLRNTMQKLKTAATDIRKDVIEIKKSN